MDREAITTANQLNSPLIRLPGEIRNRVYKLAFCGENTTRNALLKTCKQIEHEAKPIYYSNLTLSFGKPWNLRKGIVDGIRKVMGRDVEVTFGPDD